MLQAPWNAGPATIRQLTDELHPGGGAGSYATVQVLLNRLEAKGCVRLRPLGRPTPSPPPSAATS